MSPELGDSIIAPPEVYWSMAEENLLLFSSNDRRLHVLNNSAAMIWGLADIEICVSDVIDRVASTYGKTPGEVHDDVLDILDSLVGWNLCSVVLPDGEAGPFSLVADGDARPNRSPKNVAGARFEMRESTIGPFSALGSSVLIDVEDRDLAAELGRALSPLAASSDQGKCRGRLSYSVSSTAGDTFEVVRNGENIVSAGSRRECLRTILSDLNSALLEPIDDALVLHAAAAEVDGAIVAFAGVSNAGKSTLVTQLVERGGRYLTDEALMVDPHTFAAHPFTKSICVDPGAQPLLANLAPTGHSQSRDSIWDVDPRLVGPGRLSEGGPLEAFVFPLYRPCTTGASLHRIEPLDCLHRLLRNTFDFSSLGQVGFVALVRMASELPAWELAHSGVGHLELIESMLADLEPVGSRSTVSL